MRRRARAPNTLVPIIAFEENPCNSTRVQDLHLHDRQRDRPPTTGGRAGDGGEPAVQRIGRHAARLDPD